MNRRSKPAARILTVTMALAMLVAGCSSDGSAGDTAGSPAVFGSADNPTPGEPSPTGASAGQESGAGPASEQSSSDSAAGSVAGTASASDGAADPKESVAAEASAAEKAAAQAAAKKAAAAKQAAKKAAQKKAAEKKAAKKKAAEKKAAEASKQHASATKGSAATSSSGLVVTTADREQAAAMVADLTTAQQAGSVIMPVASQADGSIADRGYGGVILMGQQGVIDGTGDGTPARVRALVDDLQHQRGDAVDAPLLIGVDQEYGQVARLVHGFTEFPGAAAMAATGDTELTEKVAAAAATEMRAVGVSVDFAPDADLLPQSGESAIGDRSYGTDPHTVGEFVAAAVTGYQSGGIAATIKHFPGIGGTAVDTHNELPALDVDCASWSQTDAVPMQAGADAGAALAMTGHVHFPAVGADGPPASLSSRIVTDLLRGNGYDDCVGIGYQGVTVTDSLQMAPVANSYSSGEAAWRALAAGQDLLLMPIDPGAAVDGIVAAVQSGELPSDRLAQAATEVLALRLATARVPQPSLDVVRSPEHLDLAQQAGGG